MRILVINPNTTASMTQKIGAAVKLAEGLVSLGHKTSKHGGYAAPRVKPYDGLFAAFAPEATQPQHAPDIKSRPLATSPADKHAI